MSAASDDLVKLATDIAGAAEPGEQIEAYVMRRRDLDVRVLGGEVEQLAQAESAGIGVRVVRDQRQGFAYAGLLDPIVAREVLAEARDNVAFGTPDDALALARPGATVPAPLDLVAPGFGAFSVDDKVRLALELEQATKAADSRIRTVESTDYGDAESEAAIANSHGIVASQRRTIASCSASVIADDGSGTQTAWGYDLTRDPALLDVARVAAEAAERACRLLGAQVPATARVPVVLDPFVTASFIGILSGTLSAEAVLKGRSIFKDRLGEAIASDVVGLIDDPTNADAFGATAYDAEGIPTTRLDFVRNGVLERFAHNTWTANRAGTTTTASAVRGGYASVPGVGMRSVGFTPGDASLAELLARAEGGIYVQSVQGLHSGVNPISGDFSTGCEGLRIRNGALAEPVRGATIASTLQRMLHEITAVGSEVRMLSGGPSVPVLIAEMTLGGA